MNQNQIFKKVFLLFCGFCLYGISHAQTVTGKVTDETNAPLTGVSVQVKNSTKGTSTNAEGDYSINAPHGATLIFSFIGYTTVEKKVSGNSLSVSLEKSSDNVLSDVVIVGYGTQKKVDLSSSVSVINKKDLENRPVDNAVQALQGLSPGLIVTRSSGQPGNEGWNINIRGFASLNGTNNPLVIVDGVEYADLTLINPDDIASISVLKDASAAAIYGAKAANGVLLITTKKGIVGKARVNYTGMYQLKQPIGLPNPLPFNEDATIQNIANANDGGSPTWSDAQIAQFKDPNITFVPDDPSRLYFYGEINYVKELVNKNFSTSSHNVSVSGGNDKTKYYVGLGYIDNNGMLKVGPDANKRYNGRVNLTTKFNKIFSLDSRISFTQNKVGSASSNVTGDYGLLYNLYNLRPIFPFFVPGSDNTKLLSSNSAYANFTHGGYDNYTQNVLDAVFTLKAENIVKGLVLSVNYSPHLEQDNEDIFKKTVPLYSWDFPTQTFVQNSWVNQSNSINKNRTTQGSYTSNALADYSLDKGEHHFHLLGGFQYQYYNYNRLNATQNNLVNNNLPTLNYTTNATLPVNFVSDNIQANAWVSYFGRFNYDYKNKYFVEATVRNDASSRLAPGHQSQTFPAFSAAWRISQEDWFSNSIPSINELKIRASFGKLGNAQLGQYPWQQNYLATAILNNGVYPFNNAATTYIYQGALPSPALGWETVTTTDFGLDFTLLNNRLSGSFDYYKRANDNMLISVNLPAVLGVTPSTTNAAAMETKGWDFNIGWKDRIGEVTYNAGFNLSDNINKITKYLGNVVYSEGLNKALPGNPINSIYGYKSIGYFQTTDEVTKSPKQFGTTKQGPGDIKYEDVNGDGKINGGTGTPDDHGDLVYLGNTSPRYNFGINLGAQWKGFDLSVFLQGTGKRSIMIYPREAIPFIESWRYPQDNYKNNYWTPENTNPQFPRPMRGGGTNTHINSAFVQNGAYIRLKNLQIGYTIPERVLDKIKIEKVRVFFSGQDIWTASKMWYKYFDPESPNNVSYAYPYFSTYAFGLNVTL